MERKVYLLTIIDERVRYLNGNILNYGVSIAARKEIGRLMASGYTDIVCRNEHNDIRRSTYVCMYTIYKHSLYNMYMAKNDIVSK